MSWALALGNNRIVRLGEFRRMPTSSQVPVELVSWAEGVRRGIRWPTVLERALSALVAAIVVATWSDALSGTRGYVAAFGAALVLQIAGARLYRRWDDRASEPCILEGRFEPAALAIIEEETGADLDIDDRPIAARLTLSPEGAVRVTLDWLDRDDRRSATSGRRVDPFTNPIASIVTADHLWRLVSTRAGNVVGAEVFGARSSVTIGEVAGQVGNWQAP